MSALTRFRVGRTGAAEFAALVGIGVFMAAIGAFDSRGGTVRSYVYWITVMVGGGLVGALIEPMLWRVPWLAERPWRLMVAQAVGMTPWVAVVVWLVSGFWFDEGVSPYRWVLLLTPVFIVDVMVVIMAWLIRRGQAALIRPPVREDAPPPAIREKLPPKLARAALIAVEAEDHYLRVHTDAGDALILMRLADALAALEGRAGFRTHRSWWVARDAVEHARFSRGRGELTLSNGLKAPVSRAYAGRIKAVDWAAA